MFTGLIESIGRLSSVEKTADGVVLTISHRPWDTPLEEGESIAVQGACLTVVRCQSDQFACDVLDETLARTNLALKSPGASLNLERALRLGGRFGGHIVSGHVDGIGLVSLFQKSDKDWILEIGCDEALLSGIVSKGSIACDGVSLTVTAVSRASFKVGIIPFTLEHTTLSDLQKGDTVNLETDMLGKYVQRHMEAGRHEQEFDPDILKKAGFL